MRILQLQKHLKVDLMIIPFSRGDVLERTLVVELERLGERERKTEQDVEEYLKVALQKVIGAIFNGLSKTIPRIPVVRKEFEGKLQRMSDFCVWAEAFCQSMGYPNGAFISRFKAKMEENAVTSIQGEGVAELIMKMMESVNEWTGTASELFYALKQLDESLGNIYASSLPRNPNAIGRVLNNSVVGLRSVGVIVRKYTVRNRRLISIKRVNLDS
jgi:putative DNA primase/helicase